MGSAVCCLEERSEFEVCWLSYFHGRYCGAWRQEVVDGDLALEVRDWSQRSVVWHEPLLILVLKQPYFDGASTLGRQRPLEVNVPQPKMSVAGAMLVRWSKILSVRTCPSHCAPGFGGMTEQAQEFTAGQADSGSLRHFS